VIDDGSQNRDPKVGGHDDFLARAGSQRGERDVERSGAAGYRDGMGNADEAGKFRLEGFDLFLQVDAVVTKQGARAQDSRNGFQFLFVDVVDTWKFKRKRFRSDGHGGCV